jgi:hypothetical protein
LLVIRGGLLSWPSQPNPTRRGVSRHAVTEGRHPPPKTSTARYAQQLSEGADRSPRPGTQARSGHENQQAQRPTAPRGDKARGALAEIAARLAERAQATQADDALRAEQAEAARSREAEAEVVPQIQQDQGPIISY